MLLKLALRNVRRSVRDYAIYFVTLVFGVAVFYAFNSIGSQKILFDIESSAAAGMFDLTSDFMAIFSVLIAFVLGFLIVYANRFLIRRRKREFATYLLLGMSPGAVSRIVLCETAVVGIASLATGLAVGIATAQVLSLFTAELFGLVIGDYQFVLSKPALVGTLACFAVIYAVVALLNVLSVNRLKLIDLLSAHARGEKPLVRSPKLCLAGLAAAIGILAYAYVQLRASGLVMLDDPRFLRATLSMLAGTLLLFWSLAGFVIGALSRADGAYLKGLRPFTANQVASKVNTAFLSLWATCIMLFFSVTVFSVGMGLTDVLAGDVEASAPFDATLRADVYYEDVLDTVKPSSQTIDERRNAFAENQPAVFALAESWDYDVLAKLESDAPGWGELARDAAQIDYYEVPGITYGALLKASGASTGNGEMDASLAEENLLVTPLSQLNAVRKLLGQPAITLGTGECALNNTLEISQDIAEGLVGTRYPLEIAGHTLTLQEDLLSTQTQTAMMASAALEVVVPDEVIAQMRAEGAIPLYTYVNVQYRTSGDAGDEALSNAIAEMYAVDAQAGLYDADWVEQIEAALDAGQRPISIWPVTMVTERSQMVAQSGGFKMLVTYLAIYIGLVLLVATAAVLAIQQLSETADSLPRYRTLSHLGADDRMIDRSLLIQVSFYFLLPLLIAACHSAFAIYVLTESIFTPLGMSATGPIAAAAAFIALSYGAYLLITFLTSRGMVETHLRKGARHA